MNEQMQLRAIAAELRATGWRVTIEASSKAFGLPEDLPVLDIVAKRIERLPDDARPDLLIVEAPNRQRVWTSGRKGDLSDTHEADADEALALRRIDAISDAIARLPPDEVGFQIRFLDISVDQAQARRLTQVRISDPALRGELDLTIRALEALDKSGRESALVVAFHWCRWLRLIGKRFPGRDHSELKLADLRTIQKDLWDAGILDTPPAAYHTIHQSIMALAEGGDVSWRRLKNLRRDLDQLLGFMAKRLGVEQFSAEPPSEGRQGIDLFDQIAVMIRLEDPQQAPALVEQLSRLRSTDGLPAYRQALLDFEDLAEDNARMAQFLPRLRRLARLIRD